MKQRLIQFFNLLLFLLEAFIGPFKIQPDNGQRLLAIDSTLAICNGIDIRELTISRTQALFMEDKLTPLQLTECYLERINQMNPYLNAVIETNPDATQIANSLGAIKSPDLNRFPLWGIPILLKDNIDTLDHMNTTAGSFALLGATSKIDARVVKKLRKAGAIILGKSNMSDLAGYRSFSIPEGWSSRGGQTRNPYHLNKTTHGSSAGSASGVAANLAMASLATDTCGSLISPASVGMVVGFKPSRGIIDSNGIIPLSPSFDSVGVISRTTQDNLIMTNVISESPVSCSFRPLKETIKIGVLRYPYMNDSSPDLVAKFDSMVKAVRRANFTVSDHLAIDLDFLNYQHLTMVVNTELNHYIGEYLSAHTLSNDVRTLGDIINFNKMNPTLSGIDKGFGQELLDRANDIPLSIGDKSFIELRDRIKDDAANGVQNFMKQHDINVIMVLSNSNLLPYAPASLGDLPIINIPAGITDDGLPFGISFYAMPHFDCQLFAIAKEVEVETSIRTPPAFLKD